MGCWNGTCMISNLHVTHGQDVAVFMILKNSEEDNNCYTNSFYDVCPLPFYGEYNDYGGVEECHGFGLNIVVEAIKSRLYEFGQGPNSVHDCIVNRKNFDLELMFEADSENRLGIEDASLFNHDQYDHRQLSQKHTEKGLSDAENFELDRLANKIKKVDAFRRVTHVIVHGDIFRSILNNWYIEQYVGEDGNTGYDNKYVHIYFKDLLNSIPEYIQRVKEQREELKALETEIQLSGQGMNHPASRRLFKLMNNVEFEHNDKCLAGRFMNGFRRTSQGPWGLLDASEHVSGYVEREDWDNLASFVKECLTTYWINSYMAHTRKHWTKNTGAGSQNSEHLGYEVLINAMSAVLKKENEEQAEWGFEEEDDETIGEEDEHTRV